MNKLYAIAWLSLLWLLVPCFANADLDCSQNFACDKIVTDTLRYDRSYLFEDDFHAKNWDKWLWYRCTTFSEPYDYNEWANPTIGWTDELKNNGWKVGSNTTMTVLTSSPAYRIKAVPPTRSYDNLSVKYTLEYSTDEAGKNRYAHTECINYEISRCGDGVLDTKYDEVCDPADPNKAWWWNGWCNYSCKPVNVELPACNSDYDGKRVESLVEGSYLCTKWTVTWFDYNTSTYTWTWRCNNTVWDSKSCSATKPYCGDGIKDAWETCDPADPNKVWWWNGWCDSSCKPITVEDPLCNSSYDGKRVDNLTNSPVLCTKWTVTWFDYNTSTYTWTWSCENSLKKSVDCSATKPYCGDGIKDAWETCDPADPKKAWWWNGWCSDSCQTVTVDAPLCNSDYNWKRVDNLTNSPALCTKWTVTWFDYNTSTYTWTWWCQNTLWERADCSATKPYCGDGIKDAWEACDPKDTSRAWWWNGWCSDSCQTVTVDAPLCNSDYNWKRVDNLTNSPALCTKWTVTWFDYNTSTYTWTWWCENSLWSWVNCSATKPYCGDGILDSWEVCDYKDPSKKNWWNGWCSNSCQAVTILDPLCSSSYNGKRVDSLVEWDYLCDEWTVTWFNYNTGAHIWTWSCENSLKKSVNCSATKPYCGDGIKDWGELCDYKDPSKEWWGSDGCDNYCKPIDISFNECDETFYDNLRHKWEYTFSDKFNSRWSDSWLRSFDVNFVEQKDYNKWANPTFSWTQELLDNNYKVWKNQTMRVIESSPKYKVLDTPDKRARNNLYIEYEIKYSTTQNGSANKGHKECIYYEISRCGDGVLDTEYDEICDPADPNQVGWWNGWCSDTCEPVTKVDEPECNSDYNGKTVTELVWWDYLCNKWTITGFNYNDATHTWTWRCENSLWSWVNCSANKPYDWQLVIKKTLVGSKEIKNTWDLITWNIKVTATWWNVTDFVVVDHLPSILWYSGYEITHNPWLTVSRPTLSWDDVEWDVKWTLKAWEYLEIRLTTYAKEMPRVDFTNVACVRENPNDPEKCDKVDIPVDGTLLIDKSLVGSKEIKNTWDLITWNIKVTATWWNVTDFVVVDHLPSILWYSGYEITHNPWLTVSRPTLSWDDVEWDVKWTLKAWEYLEIRLTTYAKEMPRVDFTNVACVRENPNDPEKCDKVDIPVDGTLLIDKSLVGSKEIKNTWDLITWNIKVTATWWNVTDFVVVDHLPSILWYSGYEITHNPWLTVSRPTLSWDDVEWDVKWTLKAWEYLEIRLTTYAKEMPRVDFTNVACVRENPNDPEKCDKVDIPVDGTLLIDKSLVGSKEIKNTWDLITWNIKVTATWWDVTDFIVTDHLPAVLEYSSYSIINNPWLTVSEPVVSWKNIEWTVKWTLQEGKSLEISVVTSVTEMPKIDYENVACVRENPNDPEKCDKEDLPVMKVRIIKTFTDGTKVKTVGIGDTIAYKVSFGNSGTASASITSLKDFLPKNVSYVSSEIFINWKSVHSEVVSWSEIINTWTRVDGVYVDIYGWITLNPWDSGYIILTWKVLSDNQDSRTNFACIYVNDEKIDCDDARHDITVTLACTAPVIDTKSFTKAGWTTNVVCKTAPAWEKASSIELDCGNGTKYTWSNISELSWSCTYPANTSTSSKSYSVVCKVNGDTADNCKWNVSVDWETPPPSTCFVAWTKVTMADGTEKNIEDVKIWEKILWELWENTVLWYDRPILWNRHLWSINGWEYFVSDEHPFKTTEWWKSFNPEMTKLEVDLDTTELKVWDVLVTKDWLETVEMVDYIDAEYNTPLYNFVLDWDNTYFANWYLVHNKWGTNDPYCKGPIMTWSNNNRIQDVTCKTDNGRSAEIKIDCGYKNQVYTSTGKVTELTWKCDYTWAPNGKYTILCYADNKNLSTCEGTVEYSWWWGWWGWWGKETVYVTGMSCFNVNAWNISIEKWEVLPFYWNIEKLSESVISWDYVEYETSTYKYGDNNYNSMYGQSCDKKWTIALNSMLCSFKITNWTWKVVASWTYPCLSDEVRNTENKPLIKNWIKWMEEEYGVNKPWKKVVRSLNTYGRAMWELWYVFRSNIQYIENFASTETTLWEYKITLTKVDYLYCDENKKWEKWKPYNSVCESNFMVSDSYTVQKTPSGNLTASTEKLDNYLYIDWTSPFKASDLLKAISVTAYQPSKDVDDAMDKFINKYEKLAVTVDNTGKKKVPGKNIYFISWDYPINPWEYSKPFTIVQTNPDATITVKWNSNYNMMLLTRWDIVFQWDCTTDQDVRWIFYSARNLRRGTMSKNDSIDRGVWCTHGWLHVRWVLIWNNRNNLMSQSRSNLNEWFGNNTPSYRKGIIMNWASVLIEYSPSVFTKSTMPPGAEYFTTALSVYKN